jgi:hypothetical protein
MKIRNQYNTLAGAALNYVAGLFLPGVTALQAVSDETAPQAHTAISIQIAGANAG